MRADVVGIVVPVEDPRWSHVDHFVLSKSCCNTVRATTSKKHISVIPIIPTLVGEVGLVVVICY